MRDIGVGLSYRGIHTDSLNLILSNYDESMVAVGNLFEYESVNVDGYDGAYPIGSNGKPRVFNLEFICEDFTEKDLAKVAQCFQCDSHGELIFDHSPYKYYVAHVTSQISPPKYPRLDKDKKQWVYSGTITVELTAFEPRAYLIDEILSSYPALGDGLNLVNDASGVVTLNDMPLQAFSNVVGINNIKLLNAGTANAKCDIVMTGQNINVQIVNHDTGESLVIIAPDSATHTYTVSAQYARTTDGSVLADDVHTGDFMHLIPSSPAIRDVVVTSIGTNIVTTNVVLDSTDIGKYILLNHEWFRIEDVSDTHVTLSETIIAGSYPNCVIEPMNSISIVSQNNLTSLAFIYNHTFY